MPSLILPSRFNQQPQQAPQLDAGNQLTQGLILAVLPGQSRAYDIVTRRLPVVVGTKPQPDSGGLAAGFGATLGAGTTDKVTTALAGALTTRSYFFRAKRNGAGGGNFGRLLDKTNGASGQILYWYNSGTALAYSVHTAGTERITSIPGTGTTAAVGKWFDVLVTHRYDGTDNIVEAYVNGLAVLAPTAVAAGTFNDAAATVVTIGNRADNIRNWDGLIECAYVWDRALSRVEAAALSQNRYQVFKAPARRLWMATAGVPGTITGTFAATEGQDTLAASGSLGMVPITGTLAATETPDTLAASGTVAITGLFAATEGADSLNASGSVTLPAITGTFAATEGADTLVATNIQAAPAGGGGGIAWLNAYDQMHRRRHKKRRDDDEIKPLDVAQRTQTTPIININPAQLVARMKKAENMVLAQQERAAYDRFALNLQAQALAKARAEQEDEDDVLMLLM